jgi:hypothetical protein
MNFIPEQSKESISVPYFEDATSADGWQGQSTTKSIKALQSEINEAMSRLGALIIKFEHGQFQGDDYNREGYQIYYVITAADGRQVPGRINIASLPLSPNINWYKASKMKHQEASLKMALYMLRMALDGTWLLQQLSPGYSALLPFMLGNGTDKTLSELWSESSIMNNLLPPGEDSDFVEGEAREI